ncbi:MAG: response regulator transcription factor [Planctomycetes bacterium]|nr:response regulator transcription factor [Planctomycetota bacterium]MCK5472954.1 response regulator transcription factor [Planctomycetota bacterium]
MNHTKRNIFLVDDEPGVLKVIEQTLRPLDCNVTCFDNAADCLEQIRLDGCDMLITDVRMPDMDGIELTTRAKQANPNLSVLVITGYADIPMAIRAIKTGATDFIEKPLKRDTFLQAVGSVLEKAGEIDPLVGQTLTKTEERILELIIAGKGNKEIAFMLHRSVRTVEWHRNRIMRKLNVDNIVDLIKTSVGAPAGR